MPYPRARREKQRRHGDVRHEAERGGVAVVIDRAGEAVARAGVEVIELHEVESPGQFQRR